MTKRGRTSPPRGLRAGAPAAKRAAPDALAIAREIVGALADAVVVTGLDRRIVTANRSAAQLFGRPLDDLPGTDVDDIVVPAERHHVAEQERRAREGDADLVAARAADPVFGQQEIRP